MWLECSKFIDAGAQLRACKHDFYSVWWELYLSYALTQAGVRLTPKSERPEFKGPDLLAADPPVWIEAVMPRPGDGRDALFEPANGQTFEVPVKGFTLRLRSAIEEKHQKIQQYLADGTIPADQAVIIAVSGARLPFRFNEPQIPCIVRSVYAIGDSVLEINNSTKRVSDTYALHQEKILKISNAEVSLDFFLREESEHISALLYSPSDCVNHTAHPGDDFILVHNPNARTTICRSWLQVAKQFWIDGSTLRCL